MSSTVLPTTRAQVTGHRFLRRRVEHGLVFGDIRMIHDPLAARHRAMLFGLVATVLIAVGAGLLAWLRPAADPGDAPILQTSEGALFVRVDDRVHPVANLASARLIAGEPAEPARIGAELLAATDRGVPLGIHPAPLVLGGEPAGELVWSACHRPDSGTVTVAVGDHVTPLGGHRGVLATAAGVEWLLTTAGRRQLPDPVTEEGRIIRRALGISADTPRWEPPVEVLNAAAELEPPRLPDPLPGEILDTGAGRWARVPGGIAPVSGTQAEMLADAGVPVRSVPRAELSAHPDAEFHLSLPEVAPLWLDPAQLAVCATDAGKVTTLRPGEHRPVTLSGEGTAAEFLSSLPAAVAVDTGNSLHVIDTTGLRHPVPHAADLQSLGLGAPVAAPWPVIRLLPEGAPLNAATAVGAAY
ncbi:type VII secretion protein EccB [Corynebacterium sp. YIM 101645]|uniref:Type VII secretion protein EccB n=1 Tax=Corynebacterium lemuris TaxID=1859292 RepID=A0ABT2FTF3_9CORY|nr:type VII secretion protein EccB [Corynebacterium lemuris]MCS5478501.1 type VII secretion protein EccB [Corynebacterium lemuris]